MGVSPFFCADGCPDGLDAAQESAPLLQKQSQTASPSPAGASGEKGVSFDGRLWVVSAALSA